MKPKAKIATRPLKPIQNQLANNTNKQVKKNSAIFEFYYVLGCFLKYK